MLGVIVNFFAVIVGSSIGLIFKKGIPERFSQAVMLGLGLCTVYVGIDGMLAGSNALVCIMSMSLGAIAGTAIDIDGKINRLGDRVSAKFSSREGEASIAEGFVTSTLLFCVGAMAIVGSLTSGLVGDHEILYTKSMLDAIYGMMLSVTLGFGVLLSAFAVLVYQGAIVLLAGFVEPILTTEAIAEMTCVGSVMIFGLGLNIVGITKIKVADYTPAIFIAPFIHMLFGMFM